MLDSYLIVNNVKPEQITAALSELSGFPVDVTCNTKRWFFTHGNEALLLYVFQNKLNLCLSNAQVMVDEIMLMRIFAKA